MVFFLLIKNSFAVFPHIRPAGVITLQSHQMQVLLDLRVLFEGGPYMRKYGSKVSRPLIKKSMRVAIATQASSLSAN